MHFRLKTKTKTKSKIAAKINTEYMIMLKPRNITNY